MVSKFLYFHRQIVLTHVDNVIIWSQYQQFAVFCNYCKVQRTNFIYGHMHACYSSLMYLLLISCASCKHSLNSVSLSLSLSLFFVLSCIFLVDFKCRRTKIKKYYIDKTRNAWIAEGKVYLLYQITQVVIWSLTLHEETKLLCFTI